MSDITRSSSTQSVLICLHSPFNLSMSTSPKVGVLLVNSIMTFVFIIQR